MSFRKFTVFIVAIAAPAAAFAFSAPAQAQDSIDDTYVDLAIAEISVGNAFYVVVRNRGTATVYSATVDIELGDQTISVIEASGGKFEQKSGTTCTGNIAGTTCTSGVWTVGKLGVGEETGLTIRPQLATGVPTTTVVPVRAVIKDTFPAEEERFKTNNAAVAWKVGSAAAVGQYWLEASVDDLLPDAGDAVNFKFKVGTNPGTQLDDAKVRLKLDNGMGTPTATPPSGTTFAAATDLTRTWDWNLGGTGNVLEVSTTLDNPLPAGVARSDLCLTAELTARPDNLDSRPTAAEICLREDPVTLFQTGETDLLSLYHCVGETDYPCSSSDTLELLVNGDDAALAAGISRHNSIMRPEKVVIQVPDPGGRVGAGSALSWQTVSDDGGSYTDPFCSDVEEGVLLGENWDSILDLGVDAGDASTVWSNAKDQVTATGIDGGTKPGTLKIETVTCDFEFANADTGQFSDLYGIGDEAVTVNVVYIFGNLGTYLTQRTYIATHRNGTPSDTSDDVDYTATGSYIFHVGPIAELEVRNGDGNPAVPADQRAFTVVAVNNGPDDAPAAQVTVTDLNTSDYVSHSASHGTFDSITGVWTIGELREDSGYYRATGHPLGWPTLTITTNAAEDTEITAAISNNQDYQVCIDSSGDDVDISSPSETACTTEDSTNTWHTTPYYDYISDNSTAIIKAKGGTGADLPALQSAQPKTAAIEVTWDAETEVNRRQVTSYEVEWSVAGETSWTKFSDNVANPRYVDTGVKLGDTRYYRVRAVNDRNHNGPWSVPMSAMAIDPNVPAISISETALTIREGEAAEYTVTLHARPHSNVSVRVNGGGVVSPSPGTLTFTPLNFNMPRTVELTGIQDNDPDNEQVNVTHTISSSDAGYRSLAVDRVAVTVLDDDSGVSVAAERESVNEGEAIVFTLTRTGNTDSAITVDLSVSQWGSFLPADQLGDRSVDIGAGVTTKTVTVQTDNDTVRENPGSATLVVSGGTGYLVGSPRSATVRVQDDDGPPGQPGDLAAEEIDGKVRLSWSAAPVGDAPVLDYYYRVRRSDRSTWDPDWTVLVGGGGRRDHTVSDLTNGQDYVFQVRARNDTGDGAAAEVTANPLDEPEPPDVAVTSRHESLLVTWTVADDGGRDITEYQLQWKSGGEDFDTSRQATATTGVHTIPSLINGTEYRVRVQARNEAGWSGWSSEQPGTPVPRPATSVSITTDAEDGVSEPFRVTFTFTDEDHGGNRFGVQGFDVDDIEVRYSPTVGYEFSLKDFREEVSGFVYSARLEDLLEGTLNITVKARAAQSKHDGQPSTSASHSIRVEVPEAVAPSGTKIWAAEMEVGKHGDNARGYINFDLSVWRGTGKIGSLSDVDTAPGNHVAFTYAGKDYIVGEVSYVPAWSSILFAVCPGIEGVNRTFDLYLDDQNEDHDDLTLSFDSGEVGTSNFDSTIDGDRQTCVEYRWQPRQVDWQENGKVYVRLVR